jgi:6,7-dimethyl-8-ribityllumazine synthase
MIYGKYAMKDAKIAIINATYYKDMRKSMNAHTIINAKKNAQFV